MAAVGGGDLELWVNKDITEIVEGVMRVLQFQRAIHHSALGELRSSTDPPKSEKERKESEQARAIRCLRRVNRIVKKIKTTLVVEFYNALASKAREALLLSGLTCEQVNDVLEEKWFPGRFWRGTAPQHTP